MSWKQKHEKLRERVREASGAKSMNAFDKRVTREAVGLTTEEALFVLANKYGVRDSRGFEKLSPDSQQRVSNMVQNITVGAMNTTKNVKNDYRTLNINNSPIHNLSFGDRNTVSQKVTNLERELENLFSKIDTSDSLTAIEKSDYKSDLETIASQIGKSKPNPSIIKTAWESIECLADVEGFAQLITRIAPFIVGFLS